MPRLDKDTLDRLGHITAYPTKNGQFTVFQYCWIEERDIFYVPPECIIHEYKYPFKNDDGTWSNYDPDMEEDFYVVVITNIKWESSQMKGHRDAYETIQKGMDVSKFFEKK
jgi:hypothetical protein